MEETINMILKFKGRHCLQEGDCRKEMHLPSPYALENNQRRFASILALAESYISSGTISSPPSTESALLGTPSPPASAPTSILNTHTHTHVLKSYWKHLKRFIKKNYNSFKGVIHFVFYSSNLSHSFRWFSIYMVDFYGPFGSIWKLDSHAKYYTSFEWHE